MVDSIKAALSLLLPIQEDFVYEDIEFDKNGKAEYIVRGYSHEWQVHLRETLDKDMASLYSGINAMAKTQEEKQLAAWLISKNILPSEIYNVMTQLDENVSKLWRSSLLLRIRYQALPFGEVAGVGVCCDFVALQSARTRLMAWAENTRQAAWAIAGLGPPQPAQICSRSSASPGKWGAASRWVAASSRRGWAGESASGSQISTACSAGIKSQPRHAPLRW